MIIIGAHYDCSEKTPGADNNASGIAVMLETLKTLQSLKQLPANLLFAAYALKEPPFFGTKKMGSYIHAKTLYDKKTKNQVNDLP